MDSDKPYVVSESSSAGTTVVLYSDRTIRYIKESGLDFLRRQNAKQSLPSKDGQEKPNFFST